MTMAAFVNMGGYATFIWPAYGVAAVVMAGLVIYGVRDLARLRRLLAELARPGARTRAPARSPDGQA
jgi:heme exporter protein D